MIEWPWILLIVATIFGVPYILGIRAMVRKTSGSNSEESPISKETARTVLALVERFEEMERDVEELKNHGRKKT